MSIGAVMAMLRPEFPDVTISKIRFLEDQGLVEPERTPSGYRKFSRSDVERLRYVLSVQRDQYLPLRVIRDHLEALDRGFEPQAESAGGAADVGFQPPRRPEPDVRLTRHQLREAAAVGEDLLRALESFGLVLPITGTSSYDADALTVARTAGELAAFGIEPRHLRAFRGAADREAGLVEQVVLPLRRQHDSEASARAEEVSREVAGLCVRLHAALVKAALDRDGG